MKQPGGILREIRSTGLAAEPDKNALDVPQTLHQRLVVYGLWQGLLTRMEDAKEGLRDFGTLVSMPDGCTRGFWLTSVCTSWTFRSTASANSFPAGVAEISV